LGHRGNKRKAPATNSRICDVRRASEFVVVAVRG
jgi:hypothetical protein